MYDHNYIDNDIIQGLIQKKEKLNDIFISIDKKIMMNQEELNKLSGKKDDLPVLKSFTNSKSANKIFNKKLTIPQPFNLSLNKPKLLQEPICISNNFKALPIPKNLKNISLEKIENNRNKRIKTLKEEIIERTEKDRKTLTLETEKRPTNIEKIRNMVEKNIEESLKFNKNYSNKKIDFNKYKGDVKYNEAAVLREEFLIDKKNKEEEKELNKILIEKKDRKMYDIWAAEMKIKDDMEQMEKMEKRKIEMMINRKISSNYYILKKNKNSKTYREHKMIEKMNNKNIQKEKEDDLNNKKNVVEKIKKEEENAILKKFKIIQDNNNLYQKRKKEFNELNLLTLEENKITKEKRDSIINQIRTLEKIPKKRETGFDPTETPGYGFLEEMSLAELRERLALQKKMRINELNSKREENRLKSLQRADDLFNKALSIIENRNRIRNMKEIERKNKKLMEENLNEKYRIEKENKIIKYIKDLQEKKDKERKDDENFMKKIRDIKLQLEFNKVGKDQVEYKHNENNELGLERKYNDLQNKLLEDKMAEEKINWEKIKQRFNEAKNNNQYYNNIIRNYKDNLINAKAIKKMLDDEDENFRKAVNDRERKLKQYQKDDYKERNKLSELIYLNNLKNKKISKSIVVKNKYLNTVESNNNINFNKNKIKLSEDNDNDQDENNYIRNKLKTETSLDKI